MLGGPDLAIKAAVITAGGNFVDDNRVVEIAFR